MDVLENPAPCRFDVEKVRDTIQKIAEEAGFDLVGIVNIAVSDEQLAISNKLDEWLENGYHADMKWFVDSVEKRKDILKVMPEAKSVICVAMNYYSDDKNKDNKNKKEKNVKNAITHSSAIADECVIRNSMGFNEAVGKIARYARGRPARTTGIIPRQNDFVGLESGGDYHKIFDKKLKLFVKRLEEEILRCSQDDKDRIPAGVYPPTGGRGMTDIKFKYYCDTGPVLERMWAVKARQIFPAENLGGQARLGFVGKNTNLITKYGSWVLLGEIITNIAISDERLATSHSENSKKNCNQSASWRKVNQLKADSYKLTALNTCGSCRRCLDACPTGALVAPYTVDARKCISYLTIEHKGDIPMELREKIGNRIFGCDACQEVCPFNIGRQTEGINFKTAQFNTDNYHFNRYGVKSDNNEIDLKEILSIKTDEEFLEKFAGSSVMRAKRRGLVRNACIAAGNSGDKSLLPYLKECLNDKESIIVSHAKWAIEKLKKEI